MCLLCGGVTKAIIDFYFIVYEMACLIFGSSYLFIIVLTNCSDGKVLETINILPTNNWTILVCVQLLRHLIEQVI